MSVLVPNGSLIYLASGYGAAKTMSALSTASPGVATLVASHGVATGEYIEVTSGWSRLTDKIVRISPATLDQPVTARGLNDPPRPSSRPDRFVALTVFDNADGALRPGDLARAKIYAARASVLSRGWRVLRRWLQTIVW